MALDLQKLEALVTREELREYVKVLYIEDDFDEDLDIATTETTNIWPRDSNGKVISEALGVERLKSILLARHICPEKIEIHDRRTMLAPSDPEVAGALARDILDGADLAMISINMRRETPTTTIISAEFSTERQGQGVGFSLLHRAELRLNDDFSSYWSTQIFYYAPALEQLELSFQEPGRMRKSDQLVSPTMPLPKLQRLEISVAVLSAQTVMAILSNSRHSLTSISFCRVELFQESTWRELLGSIGSEFPRLISFDFEGLAEGAIGERKVRFRGLSRDSVDERYRIGLELYQKGPADARVVYGVRFQGDGASVLLRTIAAHVITASYR